MPRNRKLVLAVAALAVALAGVVLVACGDTVTNVYVEGDGHNTGPSPGASPSSAPAPAPSPTGAPIEIYRVAVAMVSEEVCAPPGEPNTADRTFRAGCDQMFTCTPKVRRPDGTERDATLEESGVTDAAAFRGFEIDVGTTAQFSLPSGYFRLEGSNGFNLHAKASATGTLNLRCTVRGVPGTNSYSVVP